MRLALQRLRDISTWSLDPQSLPCSSQTLCDLFPFTHFLLLYTFMVVFLFEFMVQNASFLEIIWEHLNPLSLFSHISCTLHFTAIWLSPPAPIPHSTATIICSEFLWVGTNVFLISSLQYLYLSHLNCIYHLQFDIDDMTLKLSFLTSARPLQGPLCLSSLFLFFSLPIYLCSSTFDSLYGFIYDFWSWFWFFFCTYFLRISFTLKASTITK